jgi:hypothetical protein
MSDQMIASICKSAAYGESAERTAEMHDCTDTEVKQIWADNADLIEEYKNDLTEMGVISCN